MEKTDKRIVHISHRGGGTEKYVNDLKILFHEYKHSKFSIKSSGYEKDVILVHIHSALEFEWNQKNFWGILNVVEGFIASNTPVYITCHDYQWLYPTNPNPTEEILDIERPALRNVINTIKLFSLAKFVIFPSLYIMQIYEIALKTSDNFVVAPHPDKLICSECPRYVPKIFEDTVKIAFVGEFLNYKGSDIFITLSNQVTKFRTHYRSYSVEFHVFGTITEKEKNLNRNIKFHGSYSNKAFGKILSLNNIHIVTFLSTTPETYCYALTEILYLGLTIVYLNRGAFRNRLGSSVNLFSADSISDVPSQLVRALKYVSKNSCNEDFISSVNISESVQPTKWYIMNYPIVQY